MKDAKNWNAAVMDAGNGYVYLITRVQVENAYAEDQQAYLKISFGHAMEMARDADQETIETWLHEQFIVEDFVRDGVVIKRPTYEQLLEGIDSPEIKSLRLIQIKTD